ncbi:MAG: 4Fe-4S binding protein [Bacteroidetes bacterium]|nr:4Fe-4S binding protein [Bacteroidota bacterium]
MANNSVVYTEKNNCQDCYKCIRECPVKAIKIESHSASIDQDLCISCGHCTVVCPVGAKKVRDDLDKVKFFIKNKYKTIVSLAPSYNSEYSDYSDSQIISAIKSLGVTDVSETALGAEIVSHEALNYLKDKDDGVFFSSCCPSIVSLICKYYPDYKSNLTPIMSPMIAHGKLLKKMYGEDTKIIFIGPCIAKKMEADEYNKYIDVVITFNDLKRWMDDEFINFSDFNTEIKNKFIPSKSTSGALFPIDGGMLTCMDPDAKTSDISLMSFSGVKNVEAALTNLNKAKIKGKIFIELMACEGGCINGPACNNNNSSIIKRHDVIASSEKISAENSFYNIDIKLNYDNLKKISKNEYTEEQINESLETVGKFSSADELNCGGCGYESCRDFAKAMLDGKADRTMCVSYMRKVAHDKATVILHKIPSGIVIVNENLKIIEANMNFAKLLGDEIIMIFKNDPGLENADIKKLLPFHKLFTSVLEYGEELIDKDVKIEEKNIQLSIVNIQKHKIVCAIIRDMRLPQVREDIVIERTRKVINENMKTVQKIAYLLGENVSNTEAMLNSIIETHKP